MHPNAVWQTFAAAITEEAGHNYRGMCRYNKILLPLLNTLLPLFFQVSPQNLVSSSALNSKATLKRNELSSLKGHRSADFTKVHPDRSPLVGRQPLIGQWWCHHPEECVKGLSCPRDRGFVSFLCSDPLTSFQFSGYIYVWPHGCLLTSISLRYECLFNPLS